MAEAELGSFHITSEKKKLVQNSRMDQLIAIKIKEVKRLFRWHIIVSNIRTKLIF